MSARLRRNSDFLKVLRNCTPAQRKALLEVAHDDLLEALTECCMNVYLTRRLQRRSLRLPTRSKSAQTGHLCTTAQAGADPDIFVCRSKFPGLKVGRRS